MAGPWEKYRQPGQASDASGPWTKYATKQDNPTTGFLGQMNRAIGESFDLPGPVDVVRGLTGWDPLNEAGRRAVDESSPMEAMRRAGIAVADEPPGTLVESVGRGVGEAAGVLPHFALGTGLAAGARLPGVLPRAFETISNTFARSPVATGAMEAGAGALMGAGGHAGEQAAQAPGGMAPGTGRILGETAGAFSPAAAAYGPTGAAVRAGRNALMPWLGSSARSRASNRLRQLSGEPNRDAELVTGESILGLTPAQETGNPALIGLERRLMAEEPQLREQAASRTQESIRRAQEAARAPGQGRSPRDAADFFERQETGLRDALGQRVREAEERASQRVVEIEPRMQEEQASIVLREEIENALSEAQRTNGRLWNAVPEDTTVPTSNAKAVLEKEMKRRVGRSNIPDVARDFLGEGNMAFRDQEPARDMQDLRSQLLQEARNARSGETPNRDKARIADELADAILEDMHAVEAVSAPLAAARTFTRVMHDTFHKGSIGRVLRYAGTGEAVPAGVTLRQTVGQPGVKGAIAVDELRRAAEGAPNREAAEAAMQDFVRERFRLAAVSPDGTIDPRKAQEFVRKNQSLLERFPAMRAGVDRATGDMQHAQEMRRTVDEGLKEVEQTPQGQFARAQENNEFSQALRGAKRPALAARQAMQAARRDETGQAVLGLKSSATDYLLAGGFDPKKMRARFEDRNARSALDEILSPEEIARHERLIQELEKAGASGIDVASVMDDPPSNFMELAARVVGTQSGARMARATGGGAGPSLMLSHFGSKKAMKLAEKLTQGEARRLLVEAMKPGNADLYRALLLNTGDPRQAEKAQRVISGFLGAGTATAVEEARGRDAIPYEAVRPMSPGRVANPFDLSDAGRLGRNSRLAGNNVHMLAGLLGYPGAR